MLDVSSYHQEVSFIRLDLQSISTKYICKGFMFVWGGKETSGAERADHKTTCLILYLTDFSWIFNPVNKHSPADRSKNSSSRWAREKQEDDRLKTREEERERQREGGVIIQKQCDRTRAVCVNDSESSRLTDEEKKKIIFCFCAAGSEVTQISGRHHHPPQKKKQQQTQFESRR